jgi:hypothetical protein
VPAAVVRPPATGEDRAVDRRSELSFRVDGLLARPPALDAFLRKGFLLVAPARGLTHL